MRLPTLLTLSVLISACASAQDVRTLPREVKVEDEFLTASGRWVETGERRLPAIMTEANTVTLECDRDTMTCVEAIAMLIGPEDGLGGQPGGLHSILFRHVVTEWTEESLVAEAETRASDITLVVDLASGTARRSSQETSARGATVTGPPHTTKWVLE